jgi:hypothetical protein
MVWKRLRTYENVYGLIMIYEGPEAYVYAAHIAPANISAHYTAISPQKEG